MERGDDAIIISPENNDQISIPALQKDIPELALMKIKREDFIKAQKDHGDLKTIYEQVLSQTTALNKSYSLVDELLVKNREDKLEEMTALGPVLQTQAMELRLVPKTFNSNPQLLRGNGVTLRYD
ncbi:hypothetical protein NPIL_272151 [Nephila pilipes]|uniref:Uncharacterized protein n=1 Tax=Nephila pilipes TaxID=299642 RepID=A0A8X6P3P0_NEPPI|nr:hypothetical protein NPIL_272151 [Nephila pilipes]